jgi:hypothetical protein
LVLGTSKTESTSGSLATTEWGTFACPRKADGRPTAASGGQGRQCRRSAPLTEASSTRRWRRASHWEVLGAGWCQRSRRRSGPTRVRPLSEFESGVMQSLSGDKGVVPPAIPLPLQAGIQSVRLKVETICSLLEGFSGGGELIRRKWRAQSRKRIEHPFVSMTSRGKNAPRSILEPEYEGRDHTTAPSPM